MSSVVFNSWKHFQTTKSVARKPRHDLLCRKNHNGQIRCPFAIIVRRNRDVTASQLSRELYTTTGTRFKVNCFQKNS
ncbi:hypothetical protein TNCV_1679661 [Trichonephila clavipes]|nr:hypothetical protein TNCV_1679661 [Trichonephila clavipes]